MYQVRAGSLIVIAKSAIDAVNLFDGFQNQEGPVTVCNMDGRQVDVEGLRELRAAYRREKHPPARGALLSP